MAKRYCLIQSKIHAYSAVLTLCILPPTVHALTGALAINESGAATYNIPIPVPTGVGGLTPALALTYSSQSGNGLLGMGWNLSGLSVISRCPRTKLIDGYDQPVRDKGNPLSYTNSNGDDPYCLDGQRLVRLDDGTYRTKNESFSRITYDWAGQRWVVQSKSGSKAWYQESLPKGIAVPRSWGITTIQDVNNNQININYAQRNPYVDATLGAIYNLFYLPTSITYGSYGTTVGQIDFAYESRGFDSLDGYALGVPYRLSDRLSQIKTAFRNSSAVMQNKMTVDIQYTNQQPENANPGPSRITQIQATLADGSKLPPLRFNHLQRQYSLSGGSEAPTNPSIPDLSGHGWSSSPAYHKTMQYVDVNGDGKLDICARSSAGLQCWIKTSEDVFDGTRWSVLTAMSDAAGFTDEEKKYYATIQYADINGDGKPDVCARFSNGMRCFLNSGNGFNGGEVAGPPWADAPSNTTTCNYPVETGGGGGDGNGGDGNGGVGGGDGGGGDGGGGDGGGGDGGGGDGGGGD